VKRVREGLEVARQWIVFQNILLLVILLSTIIFVLLILYKYTVRNLAVKCTLTLLLCLFRLSVTRRSRIPTWAVIRSASLVLVLAVQLVIAAAFVVFVSSKSRTTFCNVLVLVVVLAYTSTCTKIWYHY
jgi:hypothetical protein